MATKLKHLKVKKVDFVDEGANPEAHIKLFKRNDAAESSAEDNSEKSSGVLKRLIAFIAKAAGFSEEELDSTLEEIQKGGSLSFRERYNETRNRKIADEMWDICFALQSSLCSILNDDDLDSTGTSAAMQESLEEFYGVVKESVKPWSEGKETSIVRKKEAVTATDLEVMKSAVSRLNETIEKAGAASETETKNEKLEGESEMSRIDKSRMTPAEKAMLEEFEKRYGISEDPVGKAKNPPPFETENPPEEEDEETETEKKKKDVKCAKSAGEADDIYEGLNPAVAAELMALKKYRMEKEEQELTEIAKRYEVIGKKPEELVPVFKSLKAAGGSGYHDMLAILDAAVNTVESSGVFSEIGKRGSGAGDAYGGDTEAIAKARLKAAELRKTRPELTETQAMDEVLVNDAQLRAEIDK